MDELAGVLIFVTVAGALVLLLMLTLGRGLVMGWRQGRAQKRRAAARGWRLWAGDYSGRQGPAAWVGRTGLDDDSGAHWVEFSAGIEGGPAAGFVLGAAPDGGVAGWLAIDSGLPGASPLWASTSAWSAFLTPPLRALWSQAGAGALKAGYQHHFVSVRLDTGRSAPTLDQQEAVIALGEALLARCLLLILSPRS